MEDATCYDAWMWSVSYRAKLDKMINIVNIYGPWEKKQPFIAWRRSVARTAVHRKTRFYFSFLPCFWQKRALLTFGISPRMFAPCSAVSKNTPIYLFFVILPTMSLSSTFSLVFRKQQHIQIINQKVAVRTAVIPLNIF